MLFSVYKEGCMSRKKRDHGDSQVHVSELTKNMKIISLNHPCKNTIFGHDVVKEVCEDLNLDLSIRWYVDKN